MHHKYIHLVNIHEAFCMVYYRHTKEHKPRSRNSRQPVKDNRKSRNEVRKERRTIMVIEEPVQFWQDGTCRWISEITFSQQDDFLNAKGQAGTQDSKMNQRNNWSGISWIDGSEKTADRTWMIQKRIFRHSKKPEGDHQKGFGFSE